MARPGKPGKRHISGRKPSTDIFRKLAQDGPFTRTIGNALVGNRIPPKSLRLWQWSLRRRRHEPPSSREFEQEGPALRHGCHARRGSDFWFYPGPGSYG